MNEREAGDPGAARSGCGRGKGRPGDLAGGYLVAVGGAALAWTGGWAPAQTLDVERGGYLVGVVAAVDVDAIQTPRVGSHIKSLARQAICSD